MHCHPSFLHTQRVHSITVVIVNNIMISVVVVDNFRVPECCYMLDSVDHVMPFFVTKFRQSSVSCPNQIPNTYKNNDFFPTLSNSAFEAEFDSHSNEFLLVFHMPI